jgi:CHRD domain
MKKATFLITLLFISLLVIVSSAAAHPVNFRAHMSASPGVDSNGQGQAKFQLNHNNLNFIMPVSKLNGDTTAAHIHISEVPEGNGPIFVSLCGAFGPQPIPVADCGGPGNPAKGSISLSDEQVGMLMEAIAMNKAYVNVHTTDVPSGEIRGQIIINP